MKRFRGWEPVTTYTHEGGRVVSSRPEPEWDEREQDLMLALAEYEAGLCPKCGRPLSVCTDPANEFKFRTSDPVRCHATTSQSVATNKAKDARMPEALMFHTELKD